MSRWKKTGVTYFDYYLIHDINCHSIETYNKFDCFGWIRDKKEKGLVKHIGFSFHDGPELLDEVLTAHPEFEFVQLQLNYLDWESAGVQSRKCYEVAEKHGVPVFVMEPVKGGTLANVPEEVTKLFKDYNSEASVPSWAIRFAASLPNVKIVLSGMSDMDQLLDNTSYMQDLKPLNDEEKALIKKATDIINASIDIPCTGCSYCTDGCPKQIAIPELFATMNAKQIYHDWHTDYYYNAVYALPGHKASDCVKCGKCESVCPQHLPIRQLLENVAKEFEKKEA